MKCAIIQNKIIKWTKIIYKLKHKKLKCNSTINDQIKYINYIFKKIRSKVKMFSKMWNKLKI